MPSTSNSASRVTSKEPLLVRSTPSLHRSASTSPSGTSPLNPPIQNAGAALKTVISDRLNELRQAHAGTADQ